MKKLLAILALGIILFSNGAEAKKITKFKSGQIYKGTIYWSGGTSVNLPAGEWKMIARWSWNVKSIMASGVTLVQQEGNIFRGIIELTRVDTASKWISDVNLFFYEVMFANKTDGCYDRSEYYLLKRYKGGASLNCFKVRHYDPQKEIYSPDKDTKTFTSFNQSGVRRWIIKDNIKLPSIMLGSEHYFFARSVGNWFIGINYVIDPEFYGGPKTQFGSEEMSEYHRSHVNTYPKHKKYIDDWVKVGAKRHKKFEDEVGAKELHKLDLSEYGVGEIVEETKTTNITSGSGISDEIKELKKLYDEGVLTKEEFEKGKKKVLSQ